MLSERCPGSEAQAVGCSLLVWIFSGISAEMYVRILFKAPSDHGSSSYLCTHTCCLCLCQFSEETIKINLSKVCFYECYTTMFRKESLVFIQFFF